MLPNRNRKLRVIPLGGIREIGKNLTVFETDSDMIIVDCGVAFPDLDMPGVDAVIPDMTYLTENKQKIRGLFLTHGHEDHIGAIPYLFKEINVPIYGTKFTLGLVEKKLEEEGMSTSGIEMIEMHYGEMVIKGDFCVEFIRTNHSIVDSAALAIITPCGIILHTGDFKVDYTPIEGQPIDLMRMAELGEKGVLLLMSDSTNAEHRGFTMSERTVGRTFEEIFARTKGRIIVATFSSNVSRVQQIINTAVKFGRKCVICGRSMVNVIDVAIEKGYITDTDVLIDLEEIDNYPPEELVIITTGSQGEPLSALTRMAVATHRQIDIVPGDTVIISASPIPGNEKPIARMIDELCKRGATVIHKSLAEVHVSGHACEEELKLIQTIVKPKFFCPVHGEYRHLMRHKNIAVELGIPEENCFILENGRVLEFEGESVRCDEMVQAGNVLIDGLGVGDVGSIVLRDRKHLAEDGLIAVVMTVDSRTGALMAGPDVISRGFVYMRESEDIIEHIKETARDALSRGDIYGGKRDWAYKKTVIRDAIHDYVYEQTKRNPMVLPVIMDIALGENQNNQADLEE
jgi:ribonuclease J